MTENPFDQLGLKKEILTYLSQQGKLDDFLKDFYRVSQKHLHPDQGGDTNLSALVNASYQQIQQSPSQVENWIKSMQNGVNPEYLELIEGLAGEIERLQQVEKGYEELKVKYAEALTGEKGEEAAVRTTRSSKKTGTSSRSSRTPPRVEYEEPSVRTPPKSSSRKKTASGRKTSSKEKARKIIIDPIELSDIILYDAKCKPTKKYKKITVAGEAEKDTKGNYLRKTQDDWISYWKKEGKEMPDFPLFYAIVERIQETDHPGKAGLLKELKESWLSLATRFDYSKNKIIHDYGFSPKPLSCTFPYGNDYLNKLKGQKKWRSALQALLMPKDLNQAIKILHNFAGVKSYIWTPDRDERKSYPERAAFVSGSGRLGLDCGGRLGDDGRSCWVVKE